MSQAGASAGPSYQSKLDEKVALMATIGDVGTVKLRDPFQERDAYFKSGVTQAQLNALFMEAAELRKKAGDKQPIVNESHSQKLGHSSQDPITTNVEKLDIGNDKEVKGQNDADEGCKLYTLFKDVSGQAGVAMKSDVAKIHRKWVEIGVSRDMVEKLSIEIAIHCADSGASPKTQLKGVSKFAPAKCFDDLLGCIREICTLRSFCAFYAQYVWNVMISNGQAPSNYIKKGFKEESKFAAFDFFHGVKSRVSKKPVNGLVREPSLVEIIANRTNSMVLISRTTEFKDVNASTEIEITGGRIGPAPKLMVRNFKK